MVLAELGKGLTSALAKLQTTTVIDDNVVNDVCWSSGKDSFWD